MSEASKALAEVRGWLCDNLNASGAGHVCGMLSVVSRRVVQADDLESENAKLREQVHYLMKGDLLHVLTDQEYIDQCERERLMQVSIDALDKENAKLRELLQRTWDAFHDATTREFVTVKNELRELGVEVDG